METVFAGHCQDMAAELNRSLFANDLSRPGWSFIVVPPVDAKRSLPMKTQQLIARL